MDLSEPNAYIANGATTQAARAVHIPPIIPYFDTAFIRGAFDAIAPFRLSMKAFSC